MPEDGETVSKKGNNISHMKRRKRAGRQRDRKKPGGPKGPPQTPQLKVTVRNIHDADHFGSVQAVGDCIISKLLSKANERLTTAVPALEQQQTQLLLDESSLHVLVQAEEAARKALSEWRKLQESPVVVDPEKEDGEKVEATAKIAADVPKVNGAGKLVEGMEKLKIHDVKKKMGVDSVVTVRLLYIVPPKKTRRRGEKPGCAYLILTAPPIPARTLPPQPENAASTEATGTTQVGASLPTIDYSRDVARRRMMIQQSLDALTKCAEDDSKAQQDLAQCIVEESLNAKTWKTRPPGGRRDRIEGTIQDSSDYKTFFEKTLKEKEERMARPKPAPGGGGVASGTATAGTAENGQQIAAIVMHLRKKKEEEKKRKQQAKKKVKGTAKKVSAAKNKESDVNGKKQKRSKKKKKKVVVSTNQAGTSGG